LKAGDATDRRVYNSVALEVVLNKAGGGAAVSAICVVVVALLEAGSQQPIPTGGEALVALDAQGVGAVCAKELAA
jgi:hypothetical protein